MRLEINRLEGRRNDLLIEIDRAEVVSAALSVANREDLRRLPGIPRHRAATPDEAAGLAAARVPLDEHLRRLGVVGGTGDLRQRAIAISNRNLGTNHGHLAWQRAESPRVFHVREDPCDYPAYSCLSCSGDGSLAIDDLRFDLAGDRVYHARTGTDLSDRLEWATFGQRVLGGGRVARFEDLAAQFYDARHLLAFEPHRPEGEAIRRMLYDRYPSAFRDRIVAAWRERGVPRARYVHNAIGLSASRVVILQREGTIEEIGAALRDAGADDGVILDNGGSVACWVWWANRYRGGIVSPTVDYRPEGTSAIAFVLGGPAALSVPGGSVSPTVV